MISYPRLIMIELNPVIHSTLSGFEKINLEMMSNVKLLNRIDTKYVFREDRLNDFLTALSNDYCTLAINGRYFQAYENQYFDTPNLQLYLVHHNGKKNRYKLRFRRYLSSGDTYFEIKRKTNTDRTIKSRIQIDEIKDYLDNNLLQFIRNQIPVSEIEFQPSIRVLFDRLTLVSKQLNERVTIDTNLRFYNHGDEKRVSNIVIVEVKQNKNTFSPFRKLMKIHRQKIFFISKYCLGIMSTNSKIKRNRFKEKLMKLKKIGYEIL